jgi:hypothetical protein
MLYFTYTPEQAEREHMISIRFGLAVCLLLLGTPLQAAPDEIMITFNPEKPVYHHGETIRIGVKCAPSNHGKFRMATPFGDDVLVGQCPAQDWPIELKTGGAVLLKGDSIVFAMLIEGGKGDAARKIPITLDKPLRSIQVSPCGTLGNDEIKDLKVIGILADGSKEDLCKWKDLRIRSSSEDVILKHDEVCTIGAQGPGKAKLSIKFEGMTAETTCTVRAGK